MHNLLFACITLISIAGNYDKPAKMITHYEYVHRNKNKQKWAEFDLNRILHSTIRRISCSWTKAYSSAFRLQITIKLKKH
jgi:hypothetical protein